MKSNLVYILFFLSITFSISAQQNNLDFEQNKKILFESLSFEEALQKAKKEDKLIFVDVYTDWCKPCKEMDKYVFTDSSVYSLYNSNFINIKVDGDSKIGKEFVVSIILKDTLRLFFLIIKEIC